jgi:ATP-dependent Zn protease
MKTEDDCPGMTNEAQRMATAIHECGHAVCSLTAGNAVPLVELASVGLSVNSAWGYCHNFTPDGPLRQIIDPINTSTSETAMTRQSFKDAMSMATPQQRQQAVRYLRSYYCTSLAGTMAEEIAYGYGNLGEGDAQNARNIQRLYLTQAEANFLREQTRLMLLKRWPLVLGMARELVRTGMIFHPQLPEEPGWPPALPVKA